ncbi:hypothetical protein F5Y18DRAFT_441132 [Xylariaceae sp. FL1019]|nr:hypothetical protein F5Y18DRAFT_441132 [Xylariaceae sp. FL1019]
MKFPISVTFLLLALSPMGLALQEFWVSYVKLFTHTNAQERHQEGGTITTVSPASFFKCDDNTWKTVIWHNSDDVSHEHYGMRVDPSKDVGPPLYRDNLNEVELNTNTFVGHQTIYADRSFGLYTTDGRMDGKCTVDRTFTMDLNCNVGEMHFEMTGSSMLHCTPI